MFLMIFSVINLSLEIESSPPCVFSPARREMRHSGCPSDWLFLRCLFFHTSSDTTMPSFNSRTTVSTLSSADTLKLAKKIQPPHFARCPLSHRHGVQGASTETQLTNLSKRSIISKRCFKKLDNLEQMLISVF